jgi:hypothetical protein
VRRAAPGCVEGRVADHGGLKGEGFGTPQGRPWRHRHGRGRRS